MALTRNDVIIAGAVSFLAWALGAHWPILRWASYAFLAGCGATLLALGALVLSTSRAPASSDSPRQCTRAPVSIDLLLPSTWKSKVQQLQDRQSEYKRVALYPPDPDISSALDDLLEVILRDFVEVWYGHISHSPSFTNAVDSALRTALAGLRDKLLSVDLVEVTVSKIVPIITDHLRESYDAEKTIRGEDLRREVTESEQLDLAIAGKYKNGQLHPAASLAYSDTKLVQQGYLRDMVEKILPDLLPADQRKSRAVEVLVREIVSCAVLFPLMKMLSDPDFWNQLMENYGRTMLQDRKTVRKLRAALDEHATPVPKTKRGVPFPRLAPHDSERQFERFIRGIRKCPNLSDARRFRSEVSSQLKREMRVEGQDQVYLKRLETGKTLLDQKVLSLTVGGPSKGGHAQPSKAASKTSSRLETATLSDILHDASGLSYFMEFMDRRGLMTLVQFWIVVDGLRNPLEDHVPDEEYLADAPLTWTESERTDLAQIFEAYMSRRELHVNEKTRETISTFLDAGKEATQNQYQQARHAILGQQLATLKEMEARHFPKFKDSDLFYKYLTSDEAVVATMPDSPTPVRKPLPKAPSQFQVPRPSSGSRAPSRMNPTGNHILRRAAASSGDLGSSGGIFDDDIKPRRSLDGHASSVDEDDTDDPMTRSRQSIDTDPMSMSVEGPEGPDHKVVEVMEAALNDIMDDTPEDVEDARSSIFGADDDMRSSLFGPAVSRVTADQETLFSDSASDFQTSNANGQREGEKPSIASLGLVNTSSRIGVFTDDDLFGDEEKFIQDEHDDPEGGESDEDNEENIHQAAPGDLGLAEAIFALASDIERLTAQDSVVDTLTRKAELTNNTAELRILRKSKASLQREIKRKELQRRQYIVQESDNSLYGRSTVKIQSIIVSTEEDGHEFASYVIEVQRKAGEQMPAATWSVARRYSEFHDLLQRLRAKYPNVRHLDFPRRRMVMKLQKDFLHKRRLALERYLGELLLLPNVCRSRDLRAFLSQSAILGPPLTPTSASGPSTNPTTTNQNDMMTRIYSTLSDGVDDILGNIPVLDSLSLAGQNLLSSAATTLASTPQLSISEDPLNAAEAEAELSAFADAAPAATTSPDKDKNDPFVKPICDLFLELFFLNRGAGANWLRGRAAVVILHQLLGSTIQRRVHSLFATFTAPPTVVRMLGALTQTLDRQGKEERAERTPAEKARSRREAGLLLEMLVPDLAGGVVGRGNAEMAARRLRGVVGNGRLMEEVVWRVVEEGWGVVFGEGRDGR